MKIQQSLILWCGLLGCLVAQTYAVVNDKPQRREAPLLDSYAPPPSTGESLGLPIPVYGVPDAPAIKYPTPPPDIPPPLPSQQYGVPILKYGPPKVQVEYGPPLPAFKPVHHHKQIFHSAPQQDFSFFDQIKSSLGFSAAKPVYGPPPKPHFPKNSYGPPPSFSHQSFSSGSSSYHHSNQFLTPPSIGFGPKPSSSYGPPPSLGRPSGPSFGGHHHGSSSLPPTPPEIRCDGWKPIPGPAIQPETSYGPPASGIPQSAPAEGNHAVENHIHSDIGGLELPHAEPSVQFHGDLNGFGLGSGAADISVIKSNSFEVGPYSYGPPPPPVSISTSYGPPSHHGGPIAISHVSHGGSFGSHGGSHGGHQISTSYGPPAFSFPKQSYKLPPAGLMPPSGVYGVPPGGTYAGLAIQHGTVSGNLKPWPVPGSAPKRPIPFRAPVPQGLLESIGHNVQHLDNFGVKPHHGGHGGGVYLPPPSELPAPPHGLNTLPLENSQRPFLSQHNFNGFPGEGRGGHDCGHGPQVLQDSYGPPPSGTVQPTAEEGHSGGYDVSGGGIADVPTGHQPHAVYGVPDFGPAFHSGGGDSLAYDTEVRSAAVPAGQQNSDSKAEPSEEEKTKAEVSGLTGLDVISAQKSQSITIPVQGALGTYQLQFQAADPLAGGDANGIDAPHQQLLSQGLLQSILSAIEQPNGQNQQVTQDIHSNHDDVAVFVRSPEGQEALAEPAPNEESR
uniref:Putative mucin 91c isoform a n=1 Tax=Lutzomyia longipalpis TaxID=7200 RepID=A0A1B0CH24_LUTLO